MDICRHSSGRVPSDLAVVASGPRQRIYAQASAEPGLVSVVLPVGIARGSLADLFAKPLRSGPSSGGLCFFVVSRTALNCGFLPILHWDFSYAAFLCALILTRANAGKFRDDEITDNWTFFSCNNSPQLSLKFARKKKITNSFRLKPVRGIVTDQMERCGKGIFFDLPSPSGDVKLLV